MQAAVALLTGAYRLSKRQVEGLCADLLGTPVSAGQVCAVEADTAAATAPATGPPAVLVTVPLGSIQTENEVPLANTVARAANAATKPSPITRAPALAAKKVPTVSTSPAPHSYEVLPRREAR